jgi:hypothetical protein
LVFLGSSSYASAPACAGVPLDGNNCLLLHHILLEQALFSMSRFQVSSFQVFFSPALIATIEVHLCHPFMSYKGKYEGVFPWHRHRPRVGFPSKIIIESNPHIPHLMENCNLSKLLEIPLSLKVCHPMSHHHCHFHQNVMFV